MRKYLKKSVCLLLLLSLIGSPFLINLNNSFIMQANATTLASLSETSIDLNVGESHKLTLNGATGEVTWKSSNPKVATVDNNGTVKALKKGVSVITAKHDGRQYVCVATITELTTSVKLNQKTANISVYDTVILSATVAPITASNRKVVWTSSNSNVAEVTPTGLVVGKSAGTATIYCKAADGSGAMDTCVVTVKPIITCFYLEGPTSSISIEEETQLEIQIYPPDYECDFIWKSSDTSVATVDDNGKVTGVSPGTTLITCETSDKSRIAAKYIDVKELVSNLTLTGPANMTKGSSEQFVANVTPETLEPQEVLKWSSSNTTIATVNNSGVVTAKKAGNVIINCRTTDGSAITKSKFITVKEGTNKPIYVTRIEIEDSINGNLSVGESAKLTTTITPSNATNKTLKWTSSNNGVVTVDQSGNIKGVGPGTASIRATSTDGYGISDVIIVKVTQPISSINISGKDTIAKGESYNYTASVIPTNYNESLEWNSSNTSVATIDNNGKLTGKSIGTTTISCEGSVSGKKATKTVKVTTNGEMISSIKLSGEDNMTVGQATYLKATIVPSNASAYRFTSSNTTIATVTSNGLVSPKRAGTVTITCEATDGSGVKATKQITVKDRITSISINKSTVSVDKGKNISVTATVLPSTANTKAIEWVSMNEDIAIVSDTGVITGVSAGSTRIYCQATDGSSAYSSITVVVTEPVTNIAISGNSTVTVGNTVQLTATVTPSSMQDYVEWSSSDKGVATVTSGGLVKGVKAGDVIITAKVGSKTVTKTITVKSASAGKVTIYDDFKYLDKNAVVKLQATTTSGTLSYNSSNDAVATVDNNGIIKCKGAGTVTITATNGSAKDEITFTVGNYQSLFRLGYNEVNVNAGANVYIEVAGTKADVYNISQTTFNVNAVRSDIGFYNYSISLRAVKTGVDYVTVFNSAGYGYTVKVNVLSSTDTTGTSGLSYDAQASDKLFNLINDYRREKGLNACKFNQKAQDAAKGQVISGHRMAEVNPNYDYALHNDYQLSCYYFYNKVNVEDFLTAWKNSYSHNRALTTASYTDMGVAVYSTPYGYCAFMTIGTPSNISGIIQ